MVIATRALLKRNNAVDMESTGTLTEIATRENGKMMNSLEMVFTTLPMAANTKEHGSQVVLMARECSCTIEVKDLM